MGYGDIVIFSRTDRFIYPKRTIKASDHSQVNLHDLKVLTTHLFMSYFRTSDIQTVKSRMVYRAPDFAVAGTYHFLFPVPDPAPPAKDGHPRGAWLEKPSEVNKLVVFPEISRIQNQDPHSLGHSDIQPVGSHRILPKPIPTVSPKPTPADPSRGGFRGVARKRPEVWRNGVPSDLLRVPATKPSQDNYNSKGADAIHNGVPHFPKDSKDAWCVKLWNPKSTSHFTAREQDKDKSYELQKNEYLIPPDKHEMSSCSTSCTPGFVLRRYGFFNKLIPPTEYCVCIATQEIRDNEGEKGKIHQNGTPSCPDFRKEKGKIQSRDASEENVKEGKSRIQGILVRPKKCFCHQMKRKKVKMEVKFCEICRTRSYGKDEEIYDGETQIKECLDENASQEKIIPCHDISGNLQNNMYFSRHGTRIFGRKSSNILKRLRQEELFQMSMNSRYSKRFYSCAMDFPQRRRQTVQFVHDGVAGYRRKD